MTIGAVIVAAGRGTRAGGTLPKQWQDLAGKPVLWHSIEVFQGHPMVRDVIVVLHPDDKTMIKEKMSRDVVTVEGGATRQASVAAGITALRDDVEKVLIHDGARPMVSRDLIDRVLMGLQVSDAAAPALPVVDALWEKTQDQGIAIRERDGLFLAQTPQGFKVEPFRNALFSATGQERDDVEVARNAGIDVKIVEGDQSNQKITLPDDLARAERLKGEGMDIRTGNGFDVHRFGVGDQVWLCGVSIPYHRGLQGHSDADVGMHAITDAIYGALGDGDIGQHFPPSDPQWKGAESHVFLSHAVARAHERGFRITNVDCTLICEQPKIGPHQAAMKQALAQIIAIPEDRISVKATTSERLGFTGREEGIAAMATATLIGS
jgi:2-C-methyl-D-erythritol 4-phosphate cytidylyltransferase/2-C-methyl-D-erythritol 2,4-cyclodiphosphate synthase